jgi:hypothetical protein
MPEIKLTRKDFLEDRQGRTFADVLDDPEQPLDQILEFFHDSHRQQRMEDSEIHHDRPALAGVVRELETLDAVDRFLATQHPRRTKRLRQVVGVVVRMIMERRGWQKTGRKGSLGVRAKISGRRNQPGSYHNTGGLAFWFLRAERYERKTGMPFQSVRQRRRDHDAHDGKGSRKDGRRKSDPGVARRNGKSSHRKDADAFREKGIR